MIVHSEEQPLESTYEHLFEFSSRNNNNNIIKIMNFYSPVSDTRCHSIGYKMRIARIKIRVDSPGRWERA